MPAAQGVLGWSLDGGNVVALAEEGELPFADYSIDRVLLVHALETSEAAGLLLKEIWRVLAGGGRLLIVAPNRRGIWARLDRTPFGSGRPYTMSQLSHLLRERAVHPDRQRNRAVRPAVARPHGAALGPGLGTRRQALVPDLRRGRADRGGKTDLRQARRRPRAAAAASSIPRRPTASRIAKAGCNPRFSRAADPTGQRRPARP